MILNQSFTELIETETDINLSEDKKRLPHYELFKYIKNNDLLKESQLFNFFTKETKY